MIRLLFALLPMLAIAAPAQGQPTAVPTVTIVETNFHIEPGVIHLVANRPVRLVFSNRSGSAHDFSAPDFFASAQGSGEPGRRGKVEVRANGEAVVTLVPARGNYRAKCTHFGHRMMGMSATIIVD